MSVTAPDAPTPGAGADRADTAAAHGPLGVIAGGGVLPRLLAEAEVASGGRAFVVAIKGAAEAWVGEYDHVVASFGQVGKIFGALREAGCRRVAFAGGVSRPNFFMRFDLTALTVAARMARLLRRGDDGLLRGVARIFEERGFELIAPHALLGDLLAPPGVLSKRAPSRRDLEDVARAAEVVEALGKVDVGQAAVIAQGRCLGLESVQGTDAMLARIAADPRRAGAPVPSGALFKAPKPGQDLRLDLPAIGPNTLKAAKAAGLNGVAVRAGAVFILDVGATAAAADAEGLFLLGWRPQECAPDPAGEAAV